MRTRKSSSLGTTPEPSSGTTSLLPLMAPSFFEIRSCSEVTKLKSPAITRCLLLSRTQLINSRCLRWDCLLLGSKYTATILIEPSLPSRWSIPTRPGTKICHCWCEKRFKKDSLTTTAIPPVCWLIPLEKIAHEGKRPSSSCLLDGDSRVSTNTEKSTDRIIEVAKLIESDERFAQKDLQFQVQALKEPQNCPRSWLENRGVFRQLLSDTKPSLRICAEFCCWRSSAVPSMIHLRARRWNSALISAPSTLISIAVPCSVIRLSKTTNPFQ